MNLSCQQLVHRSMAHLPSSNDKVMRFTIRHEMAEILVRSHMWLMKAEVEIIRGCSTQPSCGLET